MKSVFYAGASGLLAQQEYMNTVGNNIANVNTYGYQPQTTSFETLMTREMYVNTETDPLVGIGLKSVSTGLVIGNGSLQNTQIMTDFAIVGQGFFAVDNGKGGKEYTRSGSFSVSVDGDTAYLSTIDGAYVLNASGEKIEIPKAKLDDGTISNLLDYSELCEELAVYHFDYAAALNPVSNNRYVISETSGEPILLEAGEKTVIQGALEMSGVSIEDEMANLITAQRAYQLSARVVQVGDENAQTINSLRR